MTLPRFLMICALLLAIPSRTQAEPLPELHRGLNLSSWLANAPRQPVFARDFAQIKRVGFDHVRLPFNPEYVGFALTPHSNTTPPIDFISLDRAIAMAEQYDLPVVLDLHPGGPFMETLEHHVWAENSFVNLWTIIAERYKDHDSSHLIFELLNEPQYYRSEALWNKLAARTVNAIHAISPDRVLIVGAPHGSEIDALAFLQPINDPRVIYAFHFYEPYLVTHQGIHMGFEKKMIRSFRNMPYPSSRATESALLYAPTAPDPREAQAELQDYKTAPWDAAHIKARIDIARDWADLHHVHLVCGEFGVLRNHIDQESRYSWIKDARSAMDADGIGWEIWDYSDLFGIAPPTHPSAPDPVDGSVRLSDPDHGSRAFEPEALAALGLSEGSP